MYYRLLPALFVAFCTLASCKKDDPVAAERPVAGTYIGTTQLLHYGVFGNVAYAVDTTYIDSVVVMSIPGDSIEIRNFPVSNPAGYALQWPINTDNRYAIWLDSPHSLFSISFYPRVDSIRIAYYHHSSNGSGTNDTTIFKYFDGIDRRE